jgi:clan AA aspartic protease
VGAVFAKFQVANPLEAGNQTSIELLVDTGALYSVLPAPVLHGLGIAPLEQGTFRTADGRRIERSVGEAVFFYNGRRGTSKVVFGTEGDATVLGVTALEELGLEVDPTTNTLRPATLFLFLAGKKAKAAFEVDCPHCGAKLTVDAELGAVLSHEPPPEKKVDFDAQLQEVRQAESKRDEVFRQQMEAAKDRTKLLERKFEESYKKAKDQPVTKPVRDFDLE